MTILPRPSDWVRAAAGQPEHTPAVARGQLYFAFLSYSHRDEAMADWLHNELERFKVPASLAGRLTENGVIPKRLTPIFRDRHELAAADDLGREIREAIAASRCLVVLCSPAAAKSKWTNAEIEAFRKARPDGTIVAAIVSGEPFASDVPGDEEEECLPPALRQKYDKRGRPTGKRAEPLAADLRESHGGRRLGFLKIVAGMLGLGLDDLVRRETLRRQRRLAMITGGSFLGMVVAIVLAVTAIQARDAASEQRQEAEGLVAFMLGDLKDKLEPIGRLDALDGVGARVLEYYSKQDASDLTDEALLQRSRALSLTAQVAYSRGDMDTAGQLYRQAMQGTGEAISRDPEDPQRLYEHAQNVFWIGELARRRGQPAQAESAFREYKSIADRMVALEPDNLRWRMEAVYGDLNMGIALRNQRRFPAAAQHFSGALRPMESLASIDPSSAEYQKELANLLAWNADAQRDLGNLESAIRIRQRQIGFLRRLIAAGRTNVDFRRDLIPAHRGLGLLLTSTGRPHAAIAQFRIAIAEANRLIPVEPDNIIWKGLAGQVRLEFAKTLLGSGRISEAAAETRAGCDLAAQVLARDPGPTWRNLQTACIQTRARLALESGANAEALRLTERALDSAQSERNEDRTKDRYTVAAAYRLLGDVRQRMGDTEAANAAWTAGLAQLPRNMAERPPEMKERALLLERLDRKVEAKPLNDRLAKIGFRAAHKGE